ncbi:hypothetical protein B0H13DRAFT_509346 [Mycena leptocephala]|nr:hypothetical protein B0H13DRAFT_509346 [Mycena leptocephala]
MVTGETQQSPTLWTTTYLDPPDSDLHSIQDLYSIQFWTRSTWDLHYSFMVPEITLWALRFIAAQNPPENMLKIILTHFNPNNSLLEDMSIFTDFLFCLNSFFSRTVPRDCSVLDKSDYAQELIALLFKNLVRRLTDSHPLDQKIADAVVVKAAKMPDIISLSWPEERRLEPGYRFCALPGVSQEGILSALRLLRLNVDDLSSPRLDQGILQTPYNTTWLYRTLDSVGGHDPKLTSDSWQALFILRPVQGKPTAASLRTMLSVLSVADHRDLAYPACAVLDSADHWFADNELWQALQDVSIWPSLGYMANINPFYVTLGHKLSREPEWKEIISRDLPGWLGQFPTIIETRYRWFTDEHRTKFRSVLSCLWGADEAEADGFGEEATLVIVFGVLAKAWDQVHSSDWSEKQIHYYIKLLERTVAAAFTARILNDTVVVPSQRLRDTIMVHLGEALTRAGKDVKHQWSNAFSMEEDLKDGIERLGDHISRVASGILGELRSPPLQQADTVTELKYWENLEETWQQDVHALKEKFEKATSAGVSMQQSGA